MALGRDEGKKKLVVRGNLKGDREMDGLYGEWRD